MLHLSKSKYCSLWQCPKILWLKQYKPEEQVISDSVQARFSSGNEVGDLAMGLFGDFTEVTAYNGEKLDLKKMISDTKSEMAKNTHVICEASFDYNGLYCAVDLLVSENGGYAIYEVKSSTHDDNSVYFADIAYQKYVLENCGVNVTGTYLVCINNEYVRGDELDIHGLFKITDVSNEVEAEKVNVKPNIDVAEKVLSQKDEPDIDISENCFCPYECGFWCYCSKHLPNPSVFNLYRLPRAEKFELYRNGILTYEQFITSNIESNKTRLRQIDYFLHDKGTYVDKSHIKEFLSGLSYPLYFLDFETMQPVVPPFKGIRPYQQVPFQYSLHYIEREGGELKHTEFLGVSGTDTRRALAEQLCRDIPKDVCVTAYNRSFECSRIKEMAEAFPDLAKHLTNIKDNIEDLLIPFQSGYYYNRAMGGSFSIKSVLPAIFPDDPALNYHNLEEVHNGGEAMSVFPKIKDMPIEEQKRIRHNLLKYCELDTFAMVKVWEELVRVSK